MSLLFASLSFSLKSFPEIINKSMALKNINQNRSNDIFPGIKIVY